MDTTEIIKNALDWADKRLDLKGEKLTEEQRNYITFALRHNLVKNIAVTHCCTECSDKKEKAFGKGYNLGAKEANDEILSSI